MNYWLYNFVWEDFHKTRDFIGFATEKERSAVLRGEKIVCASNGIVAGIFEIGEFCENEFAGWSEKLPFQVKLVPVGVPIHELVAKPLRYKISLEKPFGGAGPLYKFSDQEFGKIELAIKEGRKELVY